MRGGVRSQWWSCGVDVGAMILWPCVCGWWRWSGVYLVCVVGVAAVRLACVGVCVCVSVCYVVEVVAVVGGVVVVAGADGGVVLDGVCVCVR